MTRDESVTVKGSPARSLQKFIAGTLTPAQRESVLSCLPPEYATRFRAPLLINESVPVHMLNRFTEEAAKAAGEPLEEFARRAGREAADDAVQGIYRYFALVLTPTALLSKASQMWTSVYNSGTLQVQDQTHFGARIALLDFPSELAGCSRMTGWIERLAEMTKVKNLQVRQTQCFAKGAAHCEWLVRWD
jgi:predicted hydrocarbon binding protein